MRGCLLLSLAVSTVCVAVGTSCGPSGSVDVQAPDSGIVNPARPVPDAARPAPDAGLPPPASSEEDPPDASAPPPDVTPDDVSAPDAPAGPDAASAPSGPPDARVDRAAPPDVVVPPAVDMREAATPEVAPADLRPPDQRAEASTPAPAPPDAAPAGCLPSPAADELISSFEDGALTTNPVGKRGGTMWYVINATGGATATLTTPEQPVHCGSRRALRFAGTTSPTETPIARLLFVSGTTDPFFDASALGFKGIRFSLRGGVAQRVRLKVPDRNTSTAGGICTMCSDHFGADLDVTPDWLYYVLPFSALTQTGGGGPQASVSANALYGIEFVVRGLASFELFIDDVSFYR